jgi:nicotinamidase/pyrazinamidase
MQKIVIVVDTQHDFIAPEGALPVPGADAIVLSMEAWLKSLDPADTEAVLFTFDTHDAASFSGSAEAVEFPIHCEKGTAGWNNLLSIDLLDPAIPVLGLEKGVFDMWAEPHVAIRNLRDPEAPPIDRETYFQALHAKGLTEAVVFGVAADYCVRWAVDGLVERGFQVTIPAALTRGIARQIHQVVAEDFPNGSVRIEEPAL